MKFFLLIRLVCFFLVCTQFVFGQYNSLWVEDPQRPWRDGQGTIEEAVISVKPQGLYMEYGLYLTFSAQGLNFGVTDTLEVQFHFDLPPNAIVHDLWLWVGEDIMKADILDRWTASGIYNGIVNRRQDPAILFKESQTHYKLYIFPMAGNESRKIKMTYLVPITWQSESVIAPLPTNLLKTSKNPLSVFNLLFWPEADWNDPKVLEFPDIPFNTIQHPDFGEYLQADLPPAAIEANLNLKMNSPMKDGVYLSKYGDDQEGIYQLAFLPSQALEISAPRKVLFVLDYDQSNGTATIQDILFQLETMVLQQFSYTDSLNILFSESGQIRRASPNWIPADLASVESAFDIVRSSQLANFTVLPSLVHEGINWINSQGSEGCMFIASNSDSYGNFSVANPLLDNIFGAMSSRTIPIFIADYATHSVASHWFGGRNYRGNEYLYNALSRQTNGNYQRMLFTTVSFPQMIVNLIQTIGGFASGFDLHTTMNNGFCYARFDVGPETKSAYLNQPILQVGKYFGDFPFQLEASGFFNGEPFYHQSNFVADSISQADSLSEEIWAGNNVISLESEPQTTQLISDIIFFSINERVLSKYTAFLALEPSDTTFACTDCYDETGLVTGIEDDGEILPDSLGIFEAYPNPFNPKTNIRLQLPKKFYQNENELSFRIYNVLGQTVKTFSPATVHSGQRRYEFSWEGKNDAGQGVASGTYFFVVNSKTSKRVIKLLLMK